MTAIRAQLLEMLKALASALGEDRRVDGSTAGKTNGHCDEAH